MATRYAPGRKAWGECARSGRRMLLKDMTFDGRFPNLRVDPAWREEKHPQENLPKVSDGIALHRPAPQRLPQPSSPVLMGTLITGPTIVLTWTASESTVALISEYVIHRAVGEGEFGEFGTVQVTRDALAAITSQNRYEDTAIETGSTYRYYVVARAVKGGDSAPSNEIQIAVE